jgi:ribosomal protein L18E
LRAKPAERTQVEISRVGLHWESIDEDILVAGLLAGRGDITKSTEHAA